MHGELDLVSEHENKGQILIILILIHHRVFKVMMLARLLTCGCRVQLCYSFTDGYLGLSSG